MTDFLLDINGDIKITDNDFVIGDSAEQHSSLLLETEKGGFKENPTATVGLGAYLESEEKADMLRDIRQTFTADGMTVTALKIDDNIIVIDASYKN